MKRKELSMGLFGFGCVGAGLYDVIERTPGLNASIKKICVKNRNKPRRSGLDCFTFDRDEILSDPSVNVVVELIDDPDAAFEIVSAAIKSGKAVVSANKKMIAGRFTELLELQKEYQVPFLYEAACCASIPVIRNLEEYYDNDLLESIGGIVNGSTNFILTQTAEKGITYQEALKEAQLKGYAESDPVLDTEGYDAKYKLVILLAHAFGLVADPAEIVNIGINRINGLELDYAREKDKKIKLLAFAEKNSGGKVRAFVLPAFVDKDDRLFSVDDVYNGLVIKSVLADTQFFYGKGAGAHPTASAVLSDISALSYNYRYEYKKLGQTSSLCSETDTYLKVLVSSLTNINGIRHRFLKVYETFNREESGYTIGIITLAGIRRLNEVYKEQLSVVLIELVPEDEVPALKEDLSVEWVV